MNLESTVLIQELKRFSKFTYGTGTAGIDREVYCGDWFVVGRMLSDGVSFSTLGRMSQTEAQCESCSNDRFLAHVECACS
jgi:hypothetical protein